MTKTKKPTSRRNDGQDGGTEPNSERSSASDPPSVVVDPRMRRRRMEVQRDQGRRRWRRTLWVLVPLLALVVMVALAHTPLLDVDHIEVEGSGETSQGAIVQASWIARGDPMLTLDEGAAERRIGQLPWVAEANVTREWPGTVYITVTSRTPVAILVLGQGELDALVDATGRVLHIGEAPSEGLVTIVGDPSATVTEGGEVPAEARGALSVAAAAQDYLPGVLTSINLNLVGELHDEESEASAIVRFGSTDELDEKLVALSAIVAEVDLWCVETIDLQVASAPVARSAGC